MADDTSFDALAAELRSGAEGVVPLRIVRVVAAGSSPSESKLVDRDGLVARRYDLQPGTVYLLRPDQHVCARWRKATGPWVRAALQRALALA